MRASTNALEGAFQFTTEVTKLADGSFQAKAPQVPEVGTVIDSKEIHATQELQRRLQAWATGGYRQ